MSLDPILVKKNETQAGLLRTKTTLYIMGTVCSASLELLEECQHLRVLSKASFELVNVDGSIVVFVNS